MATILHETPEGLGTAAYKDVPTSGDAGNAQVVLGSDSRLTNARTPTSHTHTSSQITDLSTTIDGRVDTKINALDVTGASGIAASKTISGWSETNGKVSISTQNISITKSQVSDFPTIPTVNNATLTIQKNGTSVGTFTANASADKTINITVPTVNNATLTIQKNGTSVGTFTANASADKTIDITVPTVNNATLTIQKNGSSVGTFTANASADKTINITVPTYSYRTESSRSVILWNEKNSSGNPISISTFTAGLVCNANITVPTVTDYEPVVAFYKSNNKNRKIIATKYIDTVSNYSISLQLYNASNNDYVANEMTVDLIVIYKK